MCDLLDSSFRFVVLLVVVVLVGPVGCVNPRGFCDSSDCTICVASPPLEIVQCLREIDSCLRLAGITLPVLVFLVSPVTSLAVRPAHPVVFVVRSLDSLSSDCLLIYGSMGLDSQLETVEIALARCCVLLGLFFV